MEQLKVLFEDSLEMEVTFEMQDPQQWEFRFRSGAKQDKDGFQVDSVDSALQASSSQMNGFTFFLEASAIKVLERGESVGVL